MLGMPVNASLTPHRSTGTMRPPLLQAAQVVPAAIAAAAAISLSIFMLPGRDSVGVRAAPLDQTSESVPSILIGPRSDGAAPAASAPQQATAPVAPKAEARSLHHAVTARQGRGLAPASVSSSPKAPSSTVQAAAQPVAQKSHGRGRGQAPAPGHSPKGTSHSGRKTVGMPAVKHRAPPNRPDHGRPPERGQPPGHDKARGGTGGGGHGGGRR